MTTGMRDRGWMAALALAGLAVFAVLAWQSADRQSSVLDEGAYLLKGLAFVEGRYRPYQDGGPITNHMPLSFLVPGAIQSAFGPGLRAGRIFSIAIGALFLALLWLGLRRTAGAGWATAAVWVVALNPAMARIYSLATSQVLVAAILAAVLALAVGRDRSDRESDLAVILAGVLLLTRINLTPVLPLLVLYVFWERGRRAGIRAAVLGGLTVLLLHLLFWPGILRMWANWLPESLTPFLASHRYPEAELFWDPEVDPVSRIISFFSALRFHFVFLMGTLFAWLLMPAASEAPPGMERKGVVFLFAVFLALLLAHIWAALILDYCVFCFPVYLAFFSFLGIWVVALTFAYWREPVSRWRIAIGCGIFILVCTGMAFSDFARIGERLLEIQLPRIRDLRILPGSVELWGLLNNRFGWSYQSMLRVAPALAGLLAGSLAVLAYAGFRRWSVRRSGMQAAPSLKPFAAGVLIAGALLSPSGMLGGGFTTYECGPGILSSYERAGKMLDQAIPAGSRVYWQGTLSAVPLLYLEDVSIFPAQINLDYTYRLSGDPDELVRYGLWNETLGRRWAAQSNYLIVSDRYLDGWLAELIDADPELTRVLNTGPVETCLPETALNLYRREP